MDYAYDLSFVNDTFGVKGTNIIYGSHPYNDKGASGYTGAGGQVIELDKSISPGGCEKPSKDLSLPLELSDANNY